MSAPAPPRPTGSRAFLRSLYWKIFLWFWLATVVLLIATTWATHEVAQLTGALPPRGRNAAQAAEAVQDAITTLRERGPAALRARLPELERRLPSQLYVLDANGADLLGRTPPPSVRAALGLGTDEAPRIEGVLLATVTAADGASYRVLAPLPRLRREHPHRAGVAHEHHGGLLARLLWRGAPASVLVTRLAVAVLVSGLVCLALAHYLIGPLRRLRDASHALAGGDLAARAGPALAARADEMGELGRAFDTMATRLQGLLAAQRRLLGDVSHELRTPLARLVVALGLARRHASPAVTPALDRIELEAERLDELVGQVLTLQRLEASGASGADEPIDLAELVRDVAGDAAFEAEARLAEEGTDAATDPPEADAAAEPARRVRVAVRAPGTVHGDAEALRSALENVVRNALRHAPPGSDVDIDLDALAGRARWRVVRVRDRGPGVDPAALPHLFEPFYRADAARGRDSGGHGLGLAITERAVRRHGGEVSAANAPDGGLVVELRLPVAE